MNTFPGKSGFLTAVLSVLVMISLTLGGNASASPPCSPPSASLSVVALSLDKGAVGSVTLTGCDGGKEREFEWKFPKKLKVTRGESNLKKFKVKKGKLKVETDGKGACSAEIRLSSDIAGTFVLSNKEASIDFSPKDVTVTVSDAGSPPPSIPPSATVTFTLRLCEGATHEIRRNMVLSDLYLFSDGSCTSSPTLPGPEIRVKEGGDVEIIFINDSYNSDPHALIFPGLVVSGAGIPVDVGG